MLGMCSASSDVGTGDAFEIECSFEDQADCCSIDYQEQTLLGQCSFEYESAVDQIHVHQFLH